MTGTHMGAAHFVNQPTNQFHPVFTDILAQRAVRLVERPSPRSPQNVSGSGSAPTLPHCRCLCGAESTHSIETSTVAFGRLWFDFEPLAGANRTGFHSPYSPSGKPFSICYNLHVNSHGAPVDLIRGRGPGMILSSHGSGVVTRMVGVIDKRSCDMTQ